MDYDGVTFENIAQHIKYNLPDTEEYLENPYVDLQKLGELLNMDDESFEKEKQKARDGDILNLHWNL